MHQGELPQLLLAGVLHCPLPALSLGLGNREAAAAVVLAVHAQLAAAARCLRIAGAVVRAGALKALALRGALELFEYGRGVLVGADGERAAYGVEALLARDGGQPLEAQAVAGAAALLAVCAEDARLALPFGAVVGVFDELYTCGLRDVLAQRVEPPAVLVLRVDVGVGVEDGELGVLLLKHAHRLQRAGAAACVEQESHGTSRQLPANAVVGLC